MSDRAMQEIRRELAELQRQVRARPAVVSGVYRGATLIRIIQGNKIAEYGAGPIDIYGIKNNTGAGYDITSINASELDSGAPKTSDPDGYQDGLAWAQVVETGAIIFVAYKANGDSDTNVYLTVPEGTHAFVRRSVGVTGPSSVVYPVWLLWRF